MTKTTLAYLAGLCDGKGSWCIETNKTHKYPTPSAAMSVTYLTECADILELLQSSFGGIIGHYKDGLSRWYLTGRERMLRATNLMMPFLRVKKQAATLFLKGLEMFPETRLGIRSTKGERWWTDDKLEQIKPIMEALSRGKRRKKRKSYFVG